MYKVALQRGEWGSGRVMRWRVNRVLGGCGEL